MTALTVADELAWGALPRESQDQYRRVLREELAEELGQNGYNEGYADGLAKTRASDLSICELLAEAEKWITGDSPDLACAVDALNDIRKALE